MREVLADWHELHLVTILLFATSNSDAAVYIGMHQMANNKGATVNKYATIIGNKGAAVCVGKYRIKMHRMSLFASTSDKGPSETTRDIIGITRR